MESSADSYNASICTSCQEIFVQPTTDPASGHMRKFHFLKKDIAKSAQAGCALCILVMSKIGSFPLRAYGENHVEIKALDCYLSWQSDHYSYLHYNIADHVEPRFFVQVVCDTEVHDMDAGKMRPPSTKSECCLRLVNRWLIDCITSHPRCREIAHDPSWLPTRLIDVGSLWIDEPKVRLVDSSSLIAQSSKPQYITLSHRWSADGVKKLTSSNLDTLKMGFRLDSLSPTFQDAVQVTRKLGARFLWIDSLCIMQDSASDWIRESAEMGKVYLYSLCNLAATASSPAEEGLFQTRDPGIITPFKVHLNYKGHENFYCISEAGLWNSKISKSVLNRRGWVFQERVLSPRTLHYANQIFWECKTLQACETFPGGLPSVLNRFDDLEYRLPASLKNWLKIGKVWDWADVLEIYCNCQLTKLEDRLIALAGIAKEVQPYMQDEYLAGLWKRDLPCNLLWQLSNTGGAVKRPLSYRCPSWSWASLDFEYTDIQSIYPGIIERFLATVEQTYVESASGNTYGNLSGGYIRFKGRVDQVNFPDIPAEGKWLPNHSSYSYRLDVSTDGELIPCYCLPIAIRDDCPGEGYGLLTSCILLQPCGTDEGAFVRVGLLTVALDGKDHLPPELHWIFDFATGDTKEQALSTVVLY